MNPHLVILSALIIGSGLVSSAYAHTTVQVGQYEIEAGWGTEPPVVGFRNMFVFEVSVPGDVEGVKVGVKNAFASLDATAKFGGVSKELDVSSNPSPGHYFSNVIPTRTGSFSIQLAGEIDGTTVDVEIPVEDVETTAVLDFPPSVKSGDDDLDAVWAAIKQLQKDVEPRSGSDSDGGQAYDFAVFGLSLGAAGVVLAIIAMLKRK